MLDQKSLVSTLWLTSALALLASVLIAPPRPAGFVSVSSQTENHHLNFAPVAGQSTAQFTPGTATDAVFEINALPSENEEQDRSDALHEPRVTFRWPCSFREVSERRLITPRSIISHYPLRC